MCNEELEIVFDHVFKTFEEAMEHCILIDKDINWNVGINYIDFDNVDFKNGKVNYIQTFGEDMLEVYYPNGFMIDVGYCESIEMFVITVVKDDDWTNIVNEFQARTDIELKNTLKDAIEWVHKKILT